MKPGGAAPQAVGFTNLVRYRSHVCFEDELLPAGSPVVVVLARVVDVVVCVIVVDTGVVAAAVALVLVGVVGVLGVVAVEDGCMDVVPCSTPVVVVVVLDIL